MLLFGSLVFKKIASIFGSTSETHQHQGRKWGGNSHTYPGDHVAADLKNLNTYNVHDHHLHGALGFMPSYVSFNLESPIF